MRIRPGYQRTRARCKRLRKPTSSSGLMNLEKVCMSGWTTWRSFSAAGIVTRCNRGMCDRRPEQISAGLIHKCQIRLHEEGVRVRRTLTSSAHKCRNEAGLSMCSTTSIKQTMSNRCGFCTNSSTAMCWKTSMSARRTSAAAWRNATPMFSVNTLMANVLVPRSERLCVHVC